MSEESNDTVALLARLEEIRGQQSALRAESLRIMNCLRHLTPAREKLNERNAEIVALVRNGHTRRQVAAVVGLTTERVRQICKAAGLPPGSPSDRGPPVQGGAQP